MPAEYYQKNKESLQKKVWERYQNLSKYEKKKQKAQKGLWKILKPFWRRERNKVSVCSWTSWKSFWRWKTKDSRTWEVLLTNTCKITSRLLNKAKSFNDSRKILKMYQISLLGIARIIYLSFLCFIRKIFSQLFLNYHRTIKKYIKFPYEEVFWTFFLNCPRTITFPLVLYVQ